jgi:hypothetical protein
MQKSCGFRAFFHPDSTVGTGISPVHAPSARADFTAGREFHPALKTCSMVNIYPPSGHVNPMPGIFLFLSIPD